MFITAGVLRWADGFLSLFLEITRAATATSRMATTATMAKRATPPPPPPPPPPPLLASAEGAKLGMLGGGDTVVGTAVVSEAVVGLPLALCLPVAGVAVTRMVGGVEGAVDWVGLPEVGL